MTMSTRFKRHVCAYCGRKRVEPIMKVIGYANNNMPVWACCDYWCINYYQRSGELPQSVLFPVKGGRTLAGARAEPEQVNG